ncbi:MULTISPECIES: heavy metal sensor histidine kinase [unclassified Pseudomonas]|uniref:heavy metal sensor histidine kinase n=1 Tax=unclassified Pseudomonas TaxID=196821 RepID=UPI000D334DA7|nr:MULTISPECIES: heavy metal sensor histidine kinase [unclassified Pseudomonas]RAU40786.1 HAMP domain-containing protein [Pseudomonas sp. RIT 409]RAU48192.1 HAMP domain-containing protein [Pseudomonas sp. RIT 412]
MFERISLSRRLALLFAACTAVVSLTAGVLFNRASEAHFMELDQQLLDSKLPALRDALKDVTRAEQLSEHRQALQAELAHSPDLALQVQGPDGELWFASAPSTTPQMSNHTGLHTLTDKGISYRSYVVALRPEQADSPRLTLLLDITHHQHFLQRMQHLIWLTVGLSALATALLGAWAARRGLRPLREMTDIAASVSASSLTTRLPSHALPAELAELGLAFNAMLARLDEGFQRLSAFSADIAHELRTPLSNLLTHTQVTLTRPRALDEYREALLGNLEELQGMAQMVNAMLYLAKAEQGLLTLRRESLNLEEEVNALQEFFLPLAEEAQVTMSRQGHAVFQGDRHMLRRALSNLLDNALRFTPAQGRVAVALETTAHSVLIAVENTGQTIPAHVLPKLFDRFYRADPSRHEGSEHVGLGLAITQSIIKAHGGSIRCESQDGVTRFTIELPN